VTELACRSADLRATKSALRGGLGGFLRYPVSICVAACCWHAGGGDSTRSVVGPVAVMPLDVCVTNARAKGSRVCVGRFLSWHAPLGTGDRLISIMTTRSASSGLFLLDGSRQPAPHLASGRAGAGHASFFDFVVDTAPQQPSTCSLIVEPHKMHVNCLNCLNQPSATHAEGGGGKSLQRD